MKNIKYKFITSRWASSSALWLFMACNKRFLDKPPLGTLSPELMANEKGIQGLLIGAYSLVDGEGAPVMALLQAHPTGSLVE